MIKDPMSGRAERRPGVFIRALSIVVPRDRAENLFKCATSCPLGIQAILLNKNGRLQLDSNSDSRSRRATTLTIKPLPRLYKAKCFKLV